MSARTRIEWTDRTWNPTRGCSRVSPGCDSCYAIADAHRFSGPGLPYEGLTQIRTGGSGRVDWTGVAKFAPTVLPDPLHWREPHRIFVDSMSDVFHHSITDRQIALIFAVMIRARHHAFQVLTKRADRMREFMGEYDGDRCLQALSDSTISVPRWLGPQPSDPIWPPSNIGLGVSVENQACADKRIPALLATEAAMRFVSCEPLLEEVQIGQYLQRARAGSRVLDWVIVGGESSQPGRPARPFDVAWARSLRAQTKGRAAFFYKQAGDAPMENGAPLSLRSRKGGSLEEAPPDLRVREYPEEPWG